MAWIAACALAGLSKLTKPVETDEFMGWLADNKDHCEDKFSHKEIFRDGNASNDGQQQPRLSLSSLLGDQDVCTSGWSLDGAVEAGSRLGACDRVL